MTLARSGHGVSGASIGLRKRIPVGAGLGGGSSDAAACLIALNLLRDARLRCADLARLAAGLGSDVPFFLTGGTALVTGRGETVQALPQPRESWYVLVKPAIHVSTRQVFEALRPAGWSSGSVTRGLADRLRNGDEIDIGINSLQPVLFSLYPAAETCFRAVERLAPGRAFLSGSGPTVVAVADDREGAQTVAEAAAKLGYWTCVVRNSSTEGRDLPCRA
jgi:4-diphosphocytidyl-2-C-methyl-D-erythritol kinase